MFYGENVPRDQVVAAQAHLEVADAMLIVGFSLMVYSGFRFAQAARLGIPMAAVNLGRTRADDLLALKVERPVRGCTLVPAVIAVHRRFEGPGRFIVKMASGRCYEHRPAQSGFGAHFDAVGGDNSFHFTRNFWLVRRHGTRG